MTCQNPAFRELSFRELSFRDPCVLEGTVCIPGTGYGLRMASMSGTTLLATYSQRKQPYVIQFHSAQDGHVYATESPVVGMDAWFTACVFVPDKGLYAMVPMKGACMHTLRRFVLRMSEARTAWMCTVLRA